jgi:hypothetical protein
MKLQTCKHELTKNEQIVRADQFVYEWFESILDLVTVHLGNHIQMQISYQLISP